MNGPTPGQGRFFDAETLKALQTIERMGACDEGRVCLLDFSIVRDRLGARWEAKRSDVCALIGRLIQRAAGPSAIQTLVKDCEFLVCYAEKDKADAAGLSYRIMEEVLAHFLGACDPDDVKIDYVTSVSNGRVVADGLTSQEALAAQASKAAALRPKPRVTPEPLLIEDASRSIPIQYGLELVKSFQQSKVIGYRLSLTFLDEHGVRGLTLRERTSLPTASLLAVDLRTIMEAKSSGLVSGNYPVVILPLSIQSFSNSRARAAVFDFLNRLRAEERGRRLVEVVGVEEGVPSTRLVETAALLKPFCRGEIFQIPSGRAAIANIRSVRPRAVSVAAADLGNTASKIASGLLALGEAAKGVAPTLIVTGVDQDAVLAVCTVAGFTHVTLKQRSSPKNLTPHGRWGLILMEFSGRSVELAFSQSSKASSDAMDAWFYAFSSDGFAISRGGAVLRANRAWCELLGVSRDEAIGQTVDDLVLEADRHLFAAGRAELLRQGETQFQMRLKSRRADELWVDVSAKQGADGHTLIAVRDITQERRVAQERAENAYVTGLLRATAGSLTWQYSPEKERFFIDATREANTARLHPIPRRLPLSEAVRRFETDVDRGQFLDALARSVQTGELSSVRVRNLAEDGRREGFRVFFQGLRKEPDGRWRLVGLTQDVTELMNAQEAAEAGERAAIAAARVKSRFLANINHEFRTPLNGVLGALRLLNRETLSEPAKRLLEQGMASAEMLNAILQDLVDLADLEEGRLSLAPAAVDARALVESVVDLFTPEFNAKGLVVRAETPADPVHVRADAMRLRQILANLISNAAKFTLGGGVVVRLTTSGAGADHILRLEVEDTGIGIAPETMGMLFASFTQAESAATRQFGGLGVGLALARHLVQLMGGEIGGDSQVGQGSTFWVVVPAPLARGDAVDETSEPRQAFRALIVDDNATNRLVAQKMLEAIGAEAATAIDGASALEAVKAAPFDVVLMDIQMPVMDGVEATRAIRALPGPVSRTPIIALTANTAPEEVVSYRAAGMDGVIPKPVSPAALYAEMSRLATRETDLFRLTYYSSAKAADGKAPPGTMSAILAASKEKNMASGVTGALLFCDGWFVQTLEGSQAAVEALFDRIRSDPRHDGVTLLEGAPTETRRFGAWSMVGLVRTGVDIRDFLTSLDFDPPGLSEEEAVDLLTSIAALDDAHAAARA